MPIAQLVLGASLEFYSGGPEFDSAWGLVVNVHISIHVDATSEVQVCRCGGYEVRIKRLLEAYVSHSHWWITAVYDKDLRRLRKFCMKLHDDGREDDVMVDFPVMIHKNDGWRLPSKAKESSNARTYQRSRIDYGFFSTVDAEERRQGTSEVGYGIRDTWVDPAEAVPEVAPMTVGEVNTRVIELAELHEHDTQDLYALLKDAQDETDRRRQAQMAETLRVMRDMRREMSDMQAELLAHREQQRRARQPGPDARILDHKDASGDADSHI
ncbi:hypothetical protein Tco_0362840 [Tanacetum coccineum]